MEEINKSIEIAKTPTPLYCEECHEVMYSPMDKLSIALYEKCTTHLEEDSLEEHNLLEVAKGLCL